MAEIWVFEITHGIFTRFHNNFEKYTQIFKRKYIYIKRMIYFEVCLYSFWRVSNGIYLNKIYESSEAAVQRCS